jgi:hypothetical protein
MLVGDMSGGAQMKSRVKDSKDRVGDAPAMTGALPGPALDALSWIRALASDWEDRRRPEVQEGSSSASPLESRAASLSPPLSLS